jgi:hypothetical protein
MCSGALVVAPPTDIIELTFLWRDTVSTSSKYVIQSDKCPKGKAGWGVAVLGRMDGLKCTT